MITAGGVTSGIDFGLSVVAEIAGETAARTIQLGIEYDPAPPFDSGHPDRAPNAITSGLLNGRYDKARSAYRSASKKQPGHNRIAPGPGPAVAVHEWQRPRNVDVRRPADRSMPRHAWRKGAIISTSLSLGSMLWRVELG